MLFKIAVLAVSLSIDALGIGMSYRLKGIKITWSAKIVVGIIAAMAAFLAIFMGNQITKYFPKDIVQILGTALLCLIGIVFIRNSMLEEGEAFCDMDASSNIELLEAVLLGIGLSADTIGTGIVVAGLGMGSFVFPIMVGMTQPLFLTLGECIGQKSELFIGQNQKVCGVFAGLLLIFTAILQNLK